MPIFVRYNSSSFENVNDLHRIAKINQKRIIGKVFSDCFSVSHFKLFEYCYSIRAVIASRNPLQSAL